MQINSSHRIPIKSDLVTNLFLFYLFFCVCVLQLPVCVLERCHSVYHYVDLEPEKLLNLNIVGNAIKRYEGQQGRTANSKWNLLRVAKGFFATPDGP